MFILVLKFIQLVALELNLAMTIMANVATIVNCQHLWRLQILKRVFLKLETALRHAFRHFSGFTLIWLLPSAGRWPSPWPSNSHNLSFWLKHFFQTTVRRRTCSWRWSWWQGIYICLDHVLVNCLLFNQCHNLHNICYSTYQSRLSWKTNFILVVLLPFYVYRIWDSFCDRPRKNVLW